MTQSFVLDTRSVGSLLTPEMRFFIPAYQRGYRWESDQILALLNDLHQFENTTEPSAFYCLQPLVLVRRGEEWEVVDGQQRLTTIFLVLRYLQQGASPFSIRYERHPESVGGLNELLDAKTDDSGNRPFVSPDLHFLRNAEREIEQWFSRNEGSLTSVLTRTEDPCAKFIWYEVSRGEAIQTFKNLNAGKVRLTDAELIRALLLRKDPLLDDIERQKFALRWDQIERRLQEPEFWSFLTSGKETDSRIDLLFRLIANRATGGRLRGGELSADDRQVFDYVFSRAQEHDGLVNVWSEVEQIFSTLEEWHAETRIFHLVGFLVQQGESLGALLTLAETCKKSEFVRTLKRRVRSKMFGSDVTRDELGEILDEVEYGDKNVRAVLLCLNIAVLDGDDVQSVRLSFRGYKSRNWDIEHIRATASAEPETVDQFEVALRAISAYWDAPDRKNSKDYSDECARIKSELLPVSGELKPRRKERLEKIYRELRDRMEGAEKELGAFDGLKNLTLLPAETNRRIGAHPFAIKRAQILSEELNGSYLLPCTRYIFSKSFTPDPASLLCWTPDDADNYLNALKKTFNTFFADTWEEFT